MFDRQREPWQCSIITDCHGFDSWLSPQCGGYVLWGTADTKSTSSTTPGGGGGSGHK